MLEYVKNLKKNNWSFNILMIQRSTSQKSLNDILHAMISKKNVKGAFFYVLGFF